MISFTEKERDIQRKLVIFQYASAIGDVQKTCRYFGSGRASLYRWIDALYHSLWKKSRAHTERLPLDLELGASSNTQHLLLPLGRTVDVPQFSNTRGHVPHQTKPNGSRRR